VETEGLIASGLREGEFPETARQRLFSAGLADQKISLL